MERSRPRIPPRGSGDSDLRQWMEERPAPEGELSALFDVEEKRQMFRLVADQIRHEFQDTTWQAFWRTTVEEREVKHVARELGVTAGMVYVARSRVMKRLRDKVQELRDKHGD